jgi:hypothetical protein
MKEKIRIASGQGFWGDLILYPELVSGSLEISINKMEQTT